MITASSLCWTYLDKSGGGSDHTACQVAPSTAVKTCELFGKVPTGHGGTVAPVPDTLRWPCATHGLAP